MDVLPEGLDVAWLAVDADGHVGVFTNAGIGPIPISAFTGVEAADVPEKMIRCLSERGGFELVVKLPRPDDFIGFARRGFFAYDWQDVFRVKAKTRSYEIVCRPLQPLNLEDLGVDLVAIARRVRFDSLSFRDSANIPIENYLECWPTKPLAR